ncbi:hypothetical protein INS49_003213 [Diaporthe citri]|uniref:uncharacterized protein n=1 Tax=Diaporthe citri TaxID=83186 RepID=UPI001C7EDCB1|nr:uncharacterized protein INS49_003213 [Diaporthe citri]KAG6368994.1 hypothetical protein INS49_003213 [Diaporthe citri]
MTSMSHDFAQLVFFEVRGGDANSKWGNMYFGIAQALQFSIVGIPNTIAQEACRWAATAESTRRIMNIRYSLLPYTYTLFRKAHTAGETVLRALAWEFPNDESLKAVETQFMSGPALLVTPVLEPLATTVNGVFPGVKDGTRWYEWYTLDEVDAKPGENKTLDGPLVHQPVHIRGGYVIPIQKAGNTTKTSRKSPWTLIVALDKHGNAEGELFLDDSISYVQKATKSIKLKYTKNTLTTKVSGSYNDHLPIANITILGLKNSLGAAHMTLGKTKLNITRASLNCSSTSGYLYFTNLEEATKAGIWSADFTLSLSH